MLFDPKKIKVKDYMYNLPEERIAQFHLEDRDSSKLLLFKNGDISEKVFREIDEYIPNDSLMIFNDTKVIRARLHFKKNTGAVIEIFCLEPHGDKKEIHNAFQRKGSCKWTCLVGNAAKWKSGSLEKDFKYNNKVFKLVAEKEREDSDETAINFNWDSGELTFTEILRATGEVPLPPYVKRDAVEMDKTRYQTVYAVNDGSVAAPTAGLHFTNDVLSKLKRKNVKFGYVTLHVGLGTFRPIKAESLKDHVMHSESIFVSRELVEMLLNNSREKVIAVGTTVLRTIESLYWFGLKILSQPKKDFDEIKIKQWDPYCFDKDNLKWTYKDSLSAVLDTMKKKGRDYLYGDTELMIVPGYNFRIADALITNFHMPGSSLLLLVAAFIGNEWRDVYEFALKNNFRFLSYGDSSLLFKN
ncbi:MAG: S-adenosylmethionine:tRNA ribosyltransferase-isomerase [Ignavibacteria bacterium]|nr:S-adenosylmethionine:tRNA ribosyltransferase-isomerase [Ignavibacteria bacterium]